jgi:hypothetical protein
MSVARGFGLNGKSLYSNVCKPCEVNCNFIVDHSNGNGLGIRSLKSNGYIRNVFMNTSASPGKNDNYTNPNPVAGYALIQFKQNFNYYLGGFSGYVAPPTSTSTTSTTAGHAYQITSLGTTTLAQWQAAGLPMGLVPSVNQSFIALATGAIGGTGTVGLPAASQIVNVSIVGDPNQSIANSSIAANGGAWVLVQFNAATNSTTPTLIATAPSDNTVVGMQFMFDGSSVTIDGL